MTNEREKLLEGNKRYLTQPTAKDFAKRREETKDGQQPYAIILTCSDSRVAPEIIFDANLGEIFVIRTAGNVVDKIALGSIEYAAEHLHSPLLVVMGHEKCGAVKAAWEAVGSSHPPASSSGSGDGKPETANAAELGTVNASTHGEPSKNIATIMKAIEKAVKKAKKKNKTVEDAAAENVKVQIRTILRKSPACKKLVVEGKLKIVGAKYKLSDGTVEFFQ